MDAQTNQARIGIAAETAYGSTIAAAPLKTLRFKDESIVPQKNARWSDEINSNGDRIAVLDISKSAAGSFTSEMTYLDWVDFLVAAIRADAGTTAGGVTKYTNANVLKSFYFEKQFTDIAAFMGCYGLVISQFSLALVANEVAMATVALMGKQLTKETATKGTGAITAATRDAVMRSGADVALLKLDGSAFPSAVQSLTMTIQNNVKPKTEIMNAAPTGQHLGTLDVSFALKAYFPSMALFDAFIANTTKTLSYSISNAAGRFGFNFPALNITGHTTNVGGVNQDVMADITMLAVRGDDTKPYTVELEVEPAA